jgi:hypothetical protein
MRKLKSLAIGFVLFATSSVAFAQAGHFAATEAKDHVGEKATICGKVVDSHFASRSKGQPTFLNLDERYPKQIFTKYANKNVCVTGTIKNYKGVPEIVAEQPSQIDIQK